MVRVMLSVLCVLVCGVFVPLCVVLVRVCVVMFLCTPMFLFLLGHVPFCLVSCCCVSVYVVVVV